MLCWQEGVVIMKVFGTLGRGYFVADIPNRVLKKATETNLNF